MKIIIIFFILTFVSTAYAKNADDLYRDGNFAEAEKAYQQGDLDNPKDLRWRYNKGCAAYQNKDYEGAKNAFTSVLRRAKDNDMLSRAAYNMGNTAFMQGDFASAAEFYKQAVIYDPANSNAKYNLELSLNKLEEARKNPDKDKKDNTKDNQHKGDQKSQNKNKNQEEKDRQDKSGEKQDQDKQDNKDLSGDLNSAGRMGEKPKTELSPAEMLERKKAEALLDNIKEDRAKIMQFQAPKEKKKADSGKSW
ncbi:MAG: tetratricopeptide repeat protein [Spirochaetes bacterium]|nr:tetratricopeptide repeat protein [Spirochaetota bacterium]